MANDPAYTMAAQQILHDFNQLSDYASLPARYCNSDLPMTLVAHPTVLQAMQRQPATINVTHATTHHGRPSDTQSSCRGYDRDRSRSRERRPTSADPGPRRHSSMPRSAGRPTPTRNFDLQCKACATNGHTHTDCRMFPKVAAILDYITQHPSDSNAALHQY